MKPVSSHFPWHSVSCRQLKAYAPAADDPRIRNLGEGYAGSVHAQLRESSRAGQISLGLLAMGGVIAYGVDYGLGPTLSAGLAGVAGLASAYFLQGALRNSLAARFVKSQAEQVPDRLVQSGPQPGTLADRRFLDGGLFSHVEEIRSQQTDEVISRHVQLDASPPVGLEEDAGKGIITARTSNGTFSFAGKLELPTPGDQTLTIQGPGARQSIHANGSSWMKIDNEMGCCWAPHFFTVCESPSHPLATTRGAVDPTVRPTVRWQDQTLVVHGLRAQPFVTGREMNPDQAQVPTGEMAHHPHQRGYVELVEVPSATPQRGQMTAFSSPRVAQLYHGQRYTLRQEADGLSLIANGRTTRIDGTLQESGAVVTYLTRGLQAKQYLAAPGCQLTVTLPEGRLELRQELGKPPSVRRFWGKFDKGSVPVEECSQGYRVDVEGKQYMLDLAVPRSLLGAD